MSRYKSAVSVAQMHFPLSRQTKPAPSVVLKQKVAPYVALKEEATPA
jgi:hypothetical protein